MAECRRRGLGGIRLGARGRCWVRVPSSACTHLWGLRLDAGSFGQLADPFLLASPVCRGVLLVLQQTADVGVRLSVERAVDEGPPFLLDDIADRVLGGVACPDVL